jgi:hypothetical protein
VEFVVFGLFAVTLSYKIQNCSSTSTITMSFKISLKPSHCLNVDQRVLFMIYINILMIISPFWILHHSLLFCAVEGVPPRRSWGMSPILKELDGPISDRAKPTFAESGTVSWLKLGIFS